MISWLTEAPPTTPWTLRRKALDGFTTMSPSPVSSAVWPPLVARTVAVKCMSFMAERAGFARISAAVGVGVAVMVGLVDAVAALGLACPHATASRRPAATSSRRTSMRQAMPSPSTAAKDRIPTRRCAGRRRPPAALSTPAWRPSVPMGQPRRWLRAGRIASPAPALCQIGGGLRPPSNIQLGENRGYALFNRRQRLSELLRYLAIGVALHHQRQHSFLVDGQHGQLVAEWLPPAAPNLLDHRGGHRGIDQVVARSDGMHCTDQVIRENVRRQVACGPRPDAGE